MIKAYDVLHQFELLNSSHIVSGFVCGNSYLDTYLRSFALQDNNADQARTYVCIDVGSPASQAIVGYFTLRADSFYTEDNRVIPVVEITHLARHFSRRGQDWGNVLLSEAVAIVAMVKDHIGIRGIQLESTLEGIRLYRDFGFRDHPIPTSADGLVRMFLPTRNFPPL